MSREVALVTGARGEMGHSLIPALKERGLDVVAIDLAALPPESQRQCVECVEGSILDAELMRGLMQRHAPVEVYHLAAVLSAKAEVDPDLAHLVNVDGTYQLMRLCREAGERAGAPLRLLFPSSIAVYGLPPMSAEQRRRPIKESERTLPVGMYGCNKLYCEMVGSFLSGRAAEDGTAWLDFRAIRFPGLISADTLPTGGTTDFAPEMLHAAAQGRPYDSFVSQETRLPFMTMPDAIDALVGLGRAETRRLSTRVYNVQGFSATAGEIRAEVLEHFPGARIGFAPIAEKQKLVDSWPGAIDDAVARRDWGLSPRHDLASAVEDYLIPALRRRYAPAEK
jgi:nucleoside-diphosphate-sugar epimerase